MIHHLFQCFVVAYSCAEYNPFRGSIIVRHSQCDRAGKRFAASNKNGQENETGQSGQQGAKT
jgi:hypothetical protein